MSRRILFASRLDGWQLGKSRVFLRAGQLAQLEVGCRCRRLYVVCSRLQDVSIVRLLAQRKH